MKRMCILLLLVLLIGPTTLFAGEPVTGIGAGLSGGLPFHIGAIGEYNFGPAYATLEMGYATGSFMLRAGGGYNFPTPFVNKEWPLDIYLGVGGRLGVNLEKYDDFLGNSKLFAYGTFAIPVTWTWYADKIPLKVFVQAGPELYFGGGVGVGFTGTAGAMWVFSLKPKQSNVSNQESVGTSGVAFAPVGVAEVGVDPKPVVIADTHQEEALPEASNQVAGNEEPTLGGSDDFPVSVGEDETDSSVE